jgi:hypothetical protein
MSEYDKLPFDFYKNKDVSFNDKVGYTTDFLRDKGYDENDLIIRFSGNAKKDEPNPDGEEQQTQTLKDGFSKLKDDLKNFESSNYDGFVKQLSEQSLSTGQIVKKIFQSRCPNLTDGELNLLVYGADIKNEIGPAYKKFKSERQKEKELELEGKPKTKKEKRKKEKKTFKPINKEHAIFVEAKALLKKFLEILQKLVKEVVELAKKIGKFAVQVGTTIAAAAVISLPPSFNVPGAITLILSLISAFDDIQKQVREFLPLTEIITLLPLVLPDDKVEPVMTKVTGIFQTINTISQTISSISALLPSMTEAKQQALSTIQGQIDDTDAQIKALNREDFPNDGAYEARKNELEKSKETLSDRASRLIKS